VHAVRDHQRLVDHAAALAHLLDLASRNTYGVYLQSVHNVWEPYDHAHAQHGFVYDAVGKADGRFARIDYPRATRTVANGITDLDPNSAAGGYYIVGTYKLGTESFCHGEHGFIAHVTPPLQSGGAAAATRR
jgi:hypothetical protein